MNKMEIQHTEGMTMGAFRTAIQDAVEDYISTALKGVHGEKTFSQSFKGGSTETETLSFSFDIPKNAGMHWGIINVTDISSMTDNNAQIIVWWDNETFNYKTNRNVLKSMEGGGGSQTFTARHISETSISFKEDNNTISFEIKNKPWLGTTLDGGKFQVDYHIW